MACLFSLLEMAQFQAEAQRIVAQERVPAAPALPGPAVAAGPVGQAAFAAGAAVEEYSGGAVKWLVAECTAAVCSGQEVLGVAMVKGAKEVHVLGSERVFVYCVDGAIAMTSCRDQQDPRKNALGDRKGP